MFPNIRADIRRYTAMARRRLGAGEVVDLMLNQGLWALVVYRFGSWLSRFYVPVLSALLKMVYIILQKFVEVCTGISLPASAVIGPGLYIGHFGGIFVHGEARIGRDCAIGNGVTVGTRGLGDFGTPVIGDGVFIGVGAKVLGGIRVGNGARIGANAVVIGDVPEGATVAGVPARVVRMRADGGEERARGLHSAAVFSDEITGIV